MEEDYISKKDQDLLPASVSLVSTKDINPGDVLSMAVVQMSNSGFFIIFLLHMEKYLKKINILLKILE